MKNQNNINLETLAGGAFAEKINEALMQVAENIQNPNTEPTAKRGITVNIKFAPNKNRNMVSTSISVTTKLAATEAIDTQLIMGVNMRNGEIEIAEYDGQIPGQLSIADYMEDSEGAEPTGKPLDLRNRAKNQGSDLVPGRDFDMKTGEIYNNEPTGAVVAIKKSI